MGLVMWLKIVVLVMLSVKFNYFGWLENSDIFLLNLPLSI